MAESKISQSLLKIKTLYQPSTLPTPSSEEVMEVYRIQEAQSGIYPERWGTFFIFPASFNVERTGVFIGTSNTVRLRHYNTNGWKDTWDSIK